MAILSQAALLPRLHLASAGCSLRAVVHVPPWRTSPQVNTFATVAADLRHTWLGRFSKDQPVLKRGCRIVHFGIVGDASPQPGAVLLSQDGHESATVRSVKRGSSDVCDGGSAQALSSAGTAVSQLHSPEILAQASDATGALGTTRKQKEAKANKRRRDYLRVPGLTSAFVAVRGICPRSSTSVPKALPDHGGECAVIEPYLDSSGDGLDTSDFGTDMDFLKRSAFQDDLHTAKGILRSNALQEETETVRKKFFPYLDEFKLNADSPALTSSMVLEMLDPFLVDGRKQRMQSVVANRTYTVCPVVEGLLDPGNVAAVFRSADALGYQSVHVISNRENKRYRKNKRVSVGAEKWLDVESWSSTASCVEALRSRGYRIAVTHIAPDTIPIHEMDWTIPTAVLFGNEDQGVTEEAIMLSDVRCSIPMSGMVDSFNVSVAAGILMHYAAYDRLSRAGCHGDLLPEQQQVLTAEFCMRHSRHIPGIIDRLLDESYSSRKGCLSSLLRGEVGADIEPPDYLIRT